MKVLTYLAACIIIISTACQSPKPGNKPWRFILIIDDYNVYYRINNGEDTSLVTIYHRGSIFAPRPANTKIDTIKVHFNQADQDSLASLCHQLIVKPAEIKSTCTDFVGNLEIIVDYGQFRQSGKYESVCDWTPLSPQTKQLNAILQRNLKKARK